MSEYISLFLVLTVGLISPGPDFIIVLKNTISYSKKHGIYTAFGVALGTLVHVTYTLLGFGLVIRSNTWLLIILKYAGACYLIYIGYKSFKNDKNTYNVVKDHGTISVKKATFSGFLTNALNPKAAIFFIGVFAVMLQTDNDVNDLLLYGTMVFFQTFCWFCLVAIFFSRKKIKDYFNKAGGVIDKITGIILAGFGVKLICSRI